MEGSPVVGRPFFASAELSAPELGENVRTQHRQLLTESTGPDVYGSDRCRRRSALTVRIVDAKGQHLCCRDRPAQTNIEL